MGSSAGSYTQAEMLAKLGLAADAADTFKVKESSEMLRKKVKGRCKQPQTAKQVALVCTREEVRAFRPEKEAAAMAEARTKAQKREPGQLTIQGGREAPPEALRRE